MYRAAKCTTVGATAMISVDACVQGLSDLDEQHGKRRAIGRVGNVMG
jgi:hypothetical protein